MLSNSKLGFGLMRLPKDDEGNILQEEVARMVDAFMKSGMNYFDTAYAYGGSEASMKKALVDRYPRESFTIADKLPAWKLKSDIQIPDLFTAYNSAKTYGSNRRYDTYYKNHTQDGRGTASACIGCGQCEGVCPQHLEIISLLKNVAEEFD